MADNHISLKALVDKEHKKVIYAESDEDFVDVLFSFLTIPMGTISRLDRNHPPAMGIGCMNNLHESVEKFERRRMLTEASKVMLLYPRNGAETHCNNLKLKIEYGEPIGKCFICTGCRSSSKLTMSYYRDAVCDCGSTMNLERDLAKTLDGGVFVKEMNRFIISDDLQVMPLSSAASFSLFSKLGVMDMNSIEEKVFNLGKSEILNLLWYSLVSTTPLTETLLKQKPAPELIMGNFSQGSSIRPQMEGDATNQDGKICVKLMVSKSRKIVCYAEAREDFVNLLFSFLTVPLGYVAKEMQGGSLKRCIDHLYNSVQDLDKEYFKSDHHQAMLTIPKLPTGFSYENQPLGIEEASHPPYYYMIKHDCIQIIDDSQIPSSSEAIPMRLMNPQSNGKDGKQSKGFVIGPATFTITDNLIITPTSPILGLSVLKKLQVPFSDIEERIVHVGKEEALLLLLASFVSESALTNAFILREPKQEQEQCNAPLFGSSNRIFGSSSTTVFTSGAPTFCTSSTPAFGASSTPFRASRSRSFLFRTPRQSTLVFGSSLQSGTTSTTTPSGARSTLFGTSPVFGQSTSAFGSSPSGTTTTPPPSGARSIIFG